MKDKKRKSLSLKEKDLLIHELELSGDQSAVIKRENISKSAVSRIWDNRKKILEAYSSKPISTKKIKNSKNDIFDEKLLSWFEEQRENGVAISGMILRDKAIKIAQHLNLEDFQGSNLWISRFRRRHSISFYTIFMESEAADTVTIGKCLTEILPSIKREHLDKDIFNGTRLDFFISISRTRH